MVDILESGLSDVSAPGGISVPRAPRLAPIQTKGNVVEAAADIAKILIGGGTAIREKNIARDIDSGVEDAVSRSFQTATGVNETLQIDEAVSRLSKLRQAGAQGKDVTDRFQVALLKESKQLKSRFPHRTSVINDAFRKRGLLDPRIQLLNEQAAIEDKRVASQAAREETLINDAFEIGAAVLNEPGNFASGVNREATLNFMTRQVQNEERKNAIYRQMGIATKKTGEKVFTLRSEYIANRKTLQTITFDRALTGLRPMVNQIQQMIANAGPGDINEVKRQLRTLATQADQFRLAQSREAVGNLNPKEAEDHMAFVDRTISDMARGLVGLEDAKDLSSMKASAQALDIVTKNADIWTARELPSVFRMTRVNPQLVNSIIQVAKFKNLQKLSEDIGTELTKLTDMMPPATGTSTDTDTNLSGSEDDKGTEDKAVRLGAGIQLQSEFISKGIVAKDANETHVWAQSQAPLFNAQVSGELSSNDAGTLANQHASPNWAANFARAQTTHPETAKRLGGYSYDVTERTILNMGRELRSAKFGLGKLGVNYDINYNEEAQKFEVVNLEPRPAGIRTTTGPSRGRIKVGQQEPDPTGRFIQQPGISNRVKQLNKLVPHLTRMRQFKNGPNELNDKEFIDGLTRVVTGQQQAVALPTTQEAPARPNTGVPPTVSGDDDPVYQNLDAGDLYVAPDGSLRRRRATQPAVKPAGE